MNLIEGFGGHRQRIGALLDHCCETAEPAFRIALHFHESVMEAIAVTPSGSRDELKLRRGSLPAVTHSCGSFSLRRATAAALRSVSDNRFGAGAGGAGGCEAWFVLGLVRGGGIWTACCISCVCSV